MFRPVIVNATKLNHDKLNRQKRTHFSNTCRIISLAKANNSSLASQLTRAFVLHLANKSCLKAEHVEDDVN